MLLGARLCPAFLQHMIAECNVLVWMASQEVKVPCLLVNSPLELKVSRRIGCNAAVHFALSLQERH